MTYREYFESRVRELIAQHFLLCKSFHEAQSFISAMAVRGFRVGIVPEFYDDAPIKLSGYRVYAFRHKF